MPSNAHDELTRVRRAGRHALPRKWRRWPWVVGGVATGLLIVTTAAAGVGYVFYKEAMSVRSDLLAAKASISAIPAAVKANDTAALTTSADQVLALTTHANSTVHGPLWELASDIPLVGQNIAAVRGATEATHILVRDAVPAGLELLGTLQVDKLKVEGGGINLEPFRHAIDTLPTINAAFADAESHVAGIDRSQLHPIVNDAIGQLLDVMDQAGPALDAAEKYLPTFLQLAGSSEPRRYIVVFQNNAEIRATGGNGATSAIIEVDDGHVHKLDDDVSEEYLADGIAGRARQALPDATRALYERDLTNNTMNYPRLADFPTTAQMYRALWQQSAGTDVDGVISLDPVVLSYMLAATGPVTLEDGTQITSENAVKLLLSDTYERFGIDGLAADKYFADVSGRVFDTVSSGAWDPLTMIGQLQKGVAEQRIYAWFSRDAEQAIAVEQHIDGALLTDSAAATQVGIFLNDASYSKLEYYLATKMDVTCDAAARTVTTSLTMSNSVPSANLSGYTLAWRNNSLGLKRTTMILDAISFAVPGGTVTSIPENGDFGSWTRTGSEAGREGKSITVTIPMGETKTVSYTTTLPEGALGPLEVRYSPTVTQTPVTIADSCSTLFPAA